jgi:hypothetical protein
VKRLLIYISLLLVSCGTQKIEKSPTVADSLDKQLKSKTELYLSLITSDELLFPERCDKLTFKSLLSAAGPFQDMSAFEVAGKYSRDVVPCYPNDSKSSISRDGILAVLQDIWTHGDLVRLNRMIAYGEAHNWVVGEGPLDYTNMALLLPIIYRMQDRLSGKTNLELASSAALDSVLSGFQGHLLANYLWLKARMEGSLNALEVSLLKSLVSANPRDPMYQALYHRFTDGDMSETYKILLDSPEFPDDHLPLETGVFGWGSEPALVAYLVALAIAEGE